MLFYDVKSAWRKAAFAIFGMLIFAGCTAEKPKEEAKGEEVGPAKETPAVPPAPKGEENKEIAPPAPENKTAPAAPANVIPAAEPAAAATCRVDFQKAASDVFLIEVLDVKPADAKVTVLCPNNDMATDRGNGLFFCGGISPDKDVVAYANGKECGKANFQLPSADEVKPKPTGVNATGCSIVVAKPTIRAGESVYIDVSYASGSDTQAEFLCGDKTRKTAGGFVRETAYCKFSTPGNHSVWLKIDGEECASVPLKVE